MTAPTLVTKYVRPRDDRVLLPPTVDAGDFIVVCGSQDGDIDPAPSGWIKIARVHGSGDTQTIYALGKIADGTEDGTLLFPGAGDNTFLVYQYRGVDTTTPIGAISTNKNDLASGVSSDTTLTVSGVTTTVADSIVFALFGGDVLDETTTTPPLYTYSTPSGFSNKLSNEDSYDTLCAFDKVQSFAASSGSVACTMNTQGIMGIVFVINAISSGGSDQSLSPSLVTSTPAFYAPAVSPGTVTISPAIVSNINSFFAPAVSRGSVSVTPNLFSNVNQIYNALISLGAASLFPNFFTNVNSFPLPSVNIGDVVIAPSRVNNSNNFLVADLTVSAVTIAPQKLDNSNSFYSPIVSIGAVNISPPIFIATNIFYSSSVMPGAASLNASLVNNANNFYSSVLTINELQLQPSLFLNESIFYSLEINVGDAVLTPQFLGNANIFYPANISGNRFVYIDLSALIEPDLLVVIEPDIHVLIED